MVHGPGQHRQRACATHEACHAGAQLKGDVDTLGANFRETTR